MMRAPVERTLLRKSRVEDKRSEHRIGRRRAASAAGPQGKGWHKRSVCFLAEVCVAKYDVLRSTTLCHRARQCATPGHTVSYHKTPYDGYHVSDHAMT